MINVLGMNIYINCNVDLDCILFFEWIRSFLKGEIIVFVLLKCEDFKGNKIRFYFIFNFEKINSFYVY